MTGPRRRSGAIQAHSENAIASELDKFLRGTRIRKVHFAECSIAPPMLAYVTNIPRLSVRLKGCQKMEEAYNGRSETIRLFQGDAVYVPDNAWNNRTCAAHVNALTCI